MAVTVTSDNPLMQEHIKDPFVLFLTLAKPLMKLFNTGHESKYYDGGNGVDINVASRERKKILGPVYGDYLDFDLERDIFMHYAKLWNQCRSLIDFHPTFDSAHLPDEEHVPEDSALSEALSNIQDIVWHIMSLIVDEPVFWPFIEYADALQLDPKAKPIIPREQQLTISAAFRDVLADRSNIWGGYGEDIEAVIGFSEVYLAQRSGGASR